MKRLFLDLETTGIDHRKHGIHQIAGLIEIDGEIVEEFDHKVAPHEKAIIEAEALKVGGVTEEQIRGYDPIGRVYNRFLRMLGKYIDKFNREDKFFILGYNSNYFDVPFLRMWFELNGDVYFNSWFFKAEIDVMCLAGEYLGERVVKMPNFKLMTVARELGIEVGEEKLHDGIYDVKITRKIYNIVSGKEIEL